MTHWFNIEHTPTVEHWSRTHPSENPFVGCRNIEPLGGAQIYWDEFLYRYGCREIFKVDEFVNAIKRNFVYNEYKYEKLLATTALEYNPLNNYLITKAGSEINTLNKEKTKTGTDTTTPNLTTTETPRVVTTEVETPTIKTRETETPNLTENITKTPNTTKTTTETPGVKTRETVTPNVTEASTRTPNTVTNTIETPRVRTEETETPNTVKTTVTTPTDYSDSTSKTTYDNTLSTKLVSVVERDFDSDETAEETLTGSVTKVSEFTAGTNSTQVSNTGTETNNKTTTGSTITDKEVISGSNSTSERLSGTETEGKTKTGTNTTNFEYVSGNTTTETSQNGTNTITKTGQQEVEYDTSETDAGTEELSFLNRTDSGYMYRPPQDAIEDERKIAIFSILDIVLSDVERATLISVY